MPTHLLRHAVPADALALAPWLPTPRDLWLFAGAAYAFPFDKLQYERLFFDPADRDRQRQAFCMTDEADTVLGHAGLMAADRRSRLAHLGHVIVDPALRGQGLGLKMLAMLLAHAFEDQGLNRVELNVVAGNGPALRLYEKLGFERVGVRRRAVHTGPGPGDFADLVFMGLLREDWRNH